MRNALLFSAALLAALLFADASHAGNGVRFVGHGFHGGFGFNVSGGCGYNGASFAFVPTYAVPVQVAVPVPVPVPVAPEPTPVPPLALAAPAYAAPALAVVPSYSFGSFATYGGFSAFDTGYGHNGFHGRGVRFVGRGVGGRGFNASAQPGTGAVGLVRGAVRTVGNVVRDVIGR